jgi:hypothetical protein
MVPWLVREGREGDPRRVHALEQRPETDWRRRARASIEAYLKGLAARPTSAWVFSFDMLGAAQRMVAHRAAIMARWVAPWRTLLQIARREDPAIAETAATQRSSRRRASDPWSAFLNLVSSGPRESLRSPSKPRSGRCRTRAVPRRAGQGTQRALNFTPRSRERGGT